MNRVLSLIFLFFVFLSNAFGKEIIKYEGKKLNISKKIFILEDKVKNIKEEDIIKGLHENNFNLNKNNVLYLNNSGSTYYIRLDIQNLSPKSYLSLYGWFGPVTTSRTQISHLYINEGKVVKEKFLSKIYKDDKSNLLNYSQDTFYIAPNEIKTIYLKTDGHLVTPIILTEMENIIKEERIHLVITQIFNGLSLMILLIIIGFYLKLRKDYLLYYILIFVFTYFKSNLFLKFLRTYISYEFSYKIYAISVAAYVYFLVNFVIEILRLKIGLENVKLKSYLNFIKYLTIGLSSLYLLNILSLNEFIKLRGYVYLTTFTLVLYAAIRRYKYGWLYRGFLFSWFPQWLLYIYISAVGPFKLYIPSFDVRTFEYLEVFANLFLIAGILLYDAKELWKGTNTVKDQEEFIKIINGTDNLMHGLLTLVHSYKKHINFDRVMYFRRKIDREKEEVLYYDFSIPLTLNEREEEKKYFDLSRHLRKDSFETYHICEDVENNELYKNLVPGYRSLIALRLKFVEGSDLGYIVILNEDKIEHEYSEVMKDFRYKASLLVQYFKTIDDVRDRYGSIIVEETLRNFHIEVLRDAERDVTNTLEQLDKIKTISNKYVAANDPNVKRVLNLFYDDLEKLMINIKKDLTFDNPDKKTKKKIMFKFNIIEEMLNYLKDIVRKTTNKVNINIISQLDGDYELFGHIRIIRSIMNHYLSYIYDRIIKHNIESEITVTNSLEDGKLKIDTKIEGLFISLEDLKKDYNSEVHKVLLNTTRSKLEITSYDNSIHIIYLLNILTSDERKKFNIKHLDYDDNLDDEIDKN